MEALFMLMLIFTVLCFKAIQLAFWVLKKLLRKG